MDADMHHYMYVTVRMVLISLLMCVELAFVFGAKERQVFIGELKCRLSMTGSIVNDTVTC